MAVVHAAMLDAAERQMRQKAGAGLLGMPLLSLERLTFLFVEAGFVVLTLAIVIGLFTMAHWRWGDHKTVLSLASWATFAALIVGRRTRGWRGRQATRWVYAGAGLMLLAYVGSRFVFEVVLQRAPDRAGQLMVGRLLLWVVLGFVAWWMLRPRRKVAPPPDAAPGAARRRGAGAPRRWSTAPPAACTSRPPRRCATARASSAAPRIATRVRGVASERAVTPHGAVHVG